MCKCYEILSINTVAEILRNLKMIIFTILKAFLDQLVGIWEALNNENKNYVSLIANIKNLQNART